MAYRSPIMTPLALLICTALLGPATAFVISTASTASTQCSSSAASSLPHLDRPLHPAMPTPTTTTSRLQSTIKEELMPTPTLTKTSRLQSTVKKDLIGTPYLSDSPVMEKIDQLERDMSRNQREAQEMIDMLRTDLKMQRLLRHESHAAMDRLTEIKTDMVMRLDQMKMHYENDRKRLLLESARQIKERDEKIEEYEKELGSMRKLTKRFFRVLGSKFMRLGCKVTDRFAKEKAAAAHVFE